MSVVSVTSTMKQIWNFLIFCLFLSSAFVSGQNFNIEQNCLNCICEASSGCDKNYYYDGSVCGPFRITMGYWMDAGRPTIRKDGRIMTSNDKLDKKQNTSADFGQSFRNCANNFECAYRTVTIYMTRYARDCDGNDRIDCDDYARIHRNGPLGCYSNLDGIYETRYRTCMEKF